MKNYLFLTFFTLQAISIQPMATAHSVQPNNDSQLPQPMTIPQSMDSLANTESTEPTSVQKLQITHKKQIPSSIRKHILQHSYTLKSNIQELNKHNQSLEKLHAKFKNIDDEQTRIYRLIGSSHTTLDQDLQLEEDFKKLDTQKNQLKKRIQSLSIIIRELSAKITHLNSELNKYKEYIDTSQKQKRDRFDMAKYLTQSWNNELRKRALEVIQELESERNIEQVYQALRYWEEMNSVLPPPYQRKLERHEEF